MTTCVVWGCGSEPIKHKQRIIINIYIYIYMDMVYIYIYIYIYIYTYTSIFLYTYIHWSARRKQKVFPPRQFIHLFLGLFLKSCKTAWQQCCWPKYASRAPAEGPPTLSSGVHFVSRLLLRASHKAINKLFAPPAYRDGDVGSKYKTYVNSYI